MSLNDLFWMKCQNYSDDDIKTRTKKKGPLCFFILRYQQLGFPPQTHDHSVCIRPPLPAFNVTSQNALFQLEGSFVSFSVLSQAWPVDVVVSLLHV